MPLNLTKTYTVRSNANADLRKAIKRGECLDGEFTVQALSGGFRIIPTPVAEEATSPAGWRAPEASWPAGTTPGLARLRANRHAEKIRNEVLADQERAAADAAAAIVADSADAMAEALAAARGGSAIIAAVAVENPDLAGKADLIEEAAARGLSPAQFADIAERANHDRDAIWTVLQGSARADAAFVERQIEAVAVTHEQAAQDRDDEGDFPPGDVRALDPTASRFPANCPIEARITRRPAGFTPGKSAAKAAPDALSPEAIALLTAVVYSPALRDLEPEAKVGKWIAYKTIHESDRPHGLSVRRVPGFMTTLSRRGLVECRAEKAGQYSACVTAAGVAALAEAGR